MKHSSSSHVNKIGPLTLLQHIYRRVLGVRHEKKMKRWRFYRQSYALTLVMKSNVMTWFSTLQFPSWYAQWKNCIFCFNLTFFFYLKMLSRTYHYLNTRWYFSTVYRHFLRCWLAEKPLSLSVTFILRAWFVLWINLDMISDYMSSV